jgi:hypothetical protein
MARLGLEPCATLHHFTHPQVSGAWAGAGLGWAGLGCLAGAEPPPAEPARPSSLPRTPQSVFSDCGPALSPSPWPPRAVVRGGRRLCAPRQHPSLPGLLPHRVQPLWAAHPAVGDLQRAHVLRVHGLRDGAVAARQGGAVQAVRRGAGQHPKVGRLQAGLVWGSGAGRTSLPYGWLYASASQPYIHPPARPPAVRSLFTRAHVAAYQALKAMPGGQEAQIGIVHQHIRWAASDLLPICSHDTQCSSAVCALSHRSASDLTALGATVPQCHSPAAWCAAQVRAQGRAPDGLVRAAHGPLADHLVRRPPHDRLLQQRPLQVGGWGGGVGAAGWGEGWGSRAADWDLTARPRQAADAVVCSCMRPCIVPPAQRRSACNR